MKPTTQLNWILRASMLLALALAQPVSAATKTWTGLVDNNWHEPGNWSPSGVPAGNDTINIAFTSGGADPSVNASPPVTIASGGTLNWTCRENVNLGGLFQGGLTIASGGVFNLMGDAGGSLSFIGGVTNAGSVRWSGGTIYLYSGGSVIVNQSGGLFDARNNGSLVCFQCVGDEAVLNAGEFRKSAGTGATTIGVPFATTTGSVQAQSGIIRFNGGGSFESNYDAAAGAAIQLTGGAFTYSSLPTITGPGDIQLAGATLTLVNNPIPGLQMINGAVILEPVFQGGTITNLHLGGVNLSGNHTVSGTLSGSGNLNGDLVIASGATVNRRRGAMTGNYTLASGGTLNLTNQAIYGELTIANAATLNWTCEDGEPIGSLFQGGLTIASGGTLDLNLTGVSGGSLSLIGGITNAGTIQWNGAGRIYLYSGGSVIVNQTGGLFDAQNNGSLVCFQCVGDEAILNAGTLRKSGAGTTTTFGGVAFINTGTVNVMTGAELQMGSAGFLNATNGFLMGNGSLTFSGSSVTNQGVVAPGASPGIFTVNGNYPQAGSAVLDLEIGGFTPGTEYDRLAVSAAANLDGTIRAGLINGFFPKANDAFTVLTYASRNGSFATLDNPLPERIAWEVQYGPTSAQLVVLNTAPTLAGITNRTVNEQTLLSLTATATDQDLPTQTLTYSLDTAPAGMTINPSSGQINWTPTEAQGPGISNVTVRVTDNGTPALAHTTSFTVAVNEVNVAPQLVLPAAPTVNELVELVFVITATDSDLPVNALTYAMLSGPTGATFNPATREFRWTPTEAQGPGSFNATFSVTDNNPDAVNDQQLSATNTVAITVNEVNLAPQLAVPGPQTVDEQVEVVFTINGSDADLPANPLTYALLSGPSGATFNPATREFRWTPTEAQGPTNVTATFRVTDNSPNAINAQQLSATNSVSIAVNESNRPPVLTVPGLQIITEENLLSVSAVATDPDLPANPLTYTLVSPPTGMTINANNGAIAWTPNEPQGSNSYTITVVATDTNATALNTKSFSVTNAFTVTVNESNRPPVLTLPGNQTISELVLYTNNATATDPDLPANALTFALVSGPAGMVVTANGGISWTPTEAQGPTNVTVQIKVTDTNPLAINATSLSVTSSFTLTVSEVNVAPVVGTLLNQPGNAGETISFTATATDADQPTNTLSFSLVNPPAGASIVPGTGLFTWRLPAALANTTNTLAVRVTDNGSPNLSGTNTFTVTVNPTQPVVLTPLSYANGVFRLSVTGALGPDYVLEGGGSSSSLSSLATNTPVVMPFTFTNASGFSNQFYRVRLSP